MGNLKEILSNYEGTPSAGSWDRLSQRLDAVMPSGETPSTPQSVKGTKGLVGSVASKTIAVIVGAALATATVIGVVALSKNGKTEPTPTETSVATMDTTATEAEQTLPAEVPSSSTVIPNTENPTTTPSTPTAESTTKAAENTPTEVATMPNTTAPSTVTAKPATPITQSKTPAARPATVRPTLPAGSTLAKNIQNDPVVQQHADDEISWTQPVKIEIPNVFTPNGDGYNDYFVIKGIESCSKRQLIIRNHSGKIVYNSKSYENTWGGTDCPDGVYSYQFLYNNGSIDQTLSGSVTIIRK